MPAEMNNTCKIINFKGKQYITEDETRKSAFTVNVIKRFHSESDSADKKVLYTTENETDQIQVITCQYRTELKPGRKVSLIEEGIPKETITYPEIENFTNIYNDGIINNTTRDNFIVNTSLDKGNFISVLRAANIQTQKIIKKNSELESLLREKTNELLAVQDITSTTKVLLKNEKESRRVGMSMLKYGILPYLMYLSISLILMVSSLTMFFMWRFTGVTLFNPAALFLVSIMAVGWSITAAVGIYSVIKRSAQYENKF